MNLDILKEWIEPVLNEKDCVLYDIEWQTNQNPPILQISVEKQDGTMDLDTCAMCSDVIGTLLDNKDWYTKRIYVGSVFSRCRKRIEDGPAASRCDW